MPISSTVALRLRLGRSDENALPIIFGIYLPKQDLSVLKRRIIHYKSENLKLSTFSKASDA